MWPWEHLAFGYLLLSLGYRLRTGRPPSNEAALALALGTQFPDLVDKPLAWGLGVLPSGVSLAHSILVAVPLAAAVALLGDRLDHRAAGVAFGVGHLSHIAGDGLYPLAVHGEVGVGYMLWPLVPTPPDTGPFVATVGELWVAFLRFLATPRGQLYLGLEVAVLAAILLLWLLDGRPGAAWPERRPS